MFGFSLSELVVVIIVALVVMGPKDLPKMLRKLGQWAGKLRRAASELRAQSGIDDALRTEGLAEDLAEIRKLARGELDRVERAARFDDVARAPAAPALPSPTREDDFYVAREREYPRDGADCGEALPDNAIVYAEGLPKSALGRDPLYVTGDAAGILPPEPPPRKFGDDADGDAEAGDTEPEPAPEASAEDDAKPNEAPSEAR